MLRLRLGNGNSALKSKLRLMRSTSFVRFEIRLIAASVDGRQSKKDTEQRRIKSNPRSVPRMALTTAFVSQKKIQQTARRKVSILYCSINISVSNSSGLNHVPPQEEALRQAKHNGHRF